MEMDPQNTGGAIYKEDSAMERKNSTRSFKFPPGFRFTPTDDELIVYYLNYKINDRPLLYNIFHDVKLYDYDPEKLVENFKVPGQDKLYFFTPRSRKYPNGSRPARSASSGYWKATGSEKKIYCNHQLVGVRKTLVYYRGKAKETDSVKTDWTMQEYISEITTCKPGDSMKLDDWVLCCIHKKRGAVDNPNKLLEVSQAQSNMPTEQIANNNQSYQTSIKWNGGYGNAIMAQQFIVAPSVVADMPTEQATNNNQICQSFIDCNGGYYNAIMTQQLLRAPSTRSDMNNNQICRTSMDCNGGYGDTIMAQQLVEAPSIVARSSVQSDMPMEQTTNNSQRYQTFIDQNGGYGNTVMAQQLAAASSIVAARSMQSDMPTEQAANDNRSSLTFIDQNGGCDSRLITQLLVEAWSIAAAWSMRSNMPIEQATNNNQRHQNFIDSNGGYGNTIMAQRLAAPSMVEAPNMQLDMPTEQSTNNNRSCHAFINSNGGYDNAIMEQQLAAASSMQMTEFNDMVHPSAVVPSQQMIDFNGMVQPLTGAYGEAMANFDCMAQIEPMTDFNDMAQVLNIAHLNALRRVSSNVHNGMMSIYNNHSIGQDFQRNLSDSITHVEGLVDQFGMANGEIDEVIALRSIHPSMELLSHQPKMGKDDILRDSIKPKELDADKDGRHDANDAGSKHAEDITKPDP